MSTGSWSNIGLKSNNGQLRIPSSINAWLWIKHRVWTCRVEINTKHAYFCSQCFFGGNSRLFSDLEKKTHNIKTMGVIFLKDFQVHSLSQRSAFLKISCNEENMVVSEEKPFSSLYIMVSLQMYLINLRFSWSCLLE